VSGRPDRWFLLEIGCEELPDGMILEALRWLSREFASVLERARLGSVRFDPELLGTPRRLALRATGFLEAQADRELEVVGPRVEAAYDAQGAPTRALEGFARSQGTTVDQVYRTRTPKGECVAARKREAGRAAAAVLAEALPDLIAAVPFAKTMRWGGGTFRFARPIRWMVCLLGREVVPFEVAGIAVGRETRGPRFAGSPALEIADAADYVDLLERHGVVADFQRRHRLILETVRGECARLGKGWSLDAPDSLAEALAGLVEHPVAAAGSFDPAFLALPREVLSTAMIHHQRFFPVRQGDGSPAAHYVAVLNCPQDDAVIGGIRQGNEWVLRARLRDADFFWKEDRKRTLEDRIPDLERVLFEASLGNYRKKVERVGQLARSLAGDLRAAGRVLDLPVVERAAALCKSDLTTLMVKEFPELQGVMGGLYAREEGEPDGVRLALAEQYRGAGDAATREPFTTPESAALAIADRLDTLCGFFLLNRVPSGSKDPFGLRRSALGAIQAALDQGLHLSFTKLKDRAAEIYASQGIAPRGDGLARLLPFLEERLRFVCQEGLGLRYDAVSAALATGCDDPVDAVARARALNGIRGLPDFESLSLSYRRVRNILADSEVEALGDEKLPTQEERALLEAVQGCERRCAPLLEKRDYAGALAVLAGLRVPLDRFFEKVLVMDPEAQTRRKRLALLRRISVLLRRVGDFAEMVLEGEAGAVASARGTRG
jgi:glycyl-tRNA synthetase beta chain